MVIIIDCDDIANAIELLEEFQNDLHINDEYLQAEEGEIIYTNFGSVTK